MKNINKILVAVLVLIVSGSCKKFLDRAPISTLQEQNFYTNTSEVEAGVIGSYAAMRGVYNFDYILAGLRSDDSYISESEGDINQIDGFGEIPTNSYVSAYWTNSYFAIKQCNTVLKYLGNVTDAAKKTQFEGEVKFLRATVYFNLVRLFGDVPLVTTSVAYNDASSYPRVAASLVYAQIISDYTDAIAKLPVTQDPTQIGRVNVYAAKGMLAKVYLTQKNYAAARVLLQDLVSNPGPYALMPTFKSIWGLGNEMNSEVMFAVRYKSNSNGLGETFSYDMDKLSGSVGFRAASDLRNYSSTRPYTSAADVRRDVTFLQYASSTGSISFYDAGKVQDKGALKNDGGVDWIVLRYADILLMYAEVVNEMDGTAVGPAPATALAQYNKVRARSVIPFTAVLGTATAVKTQTAFRATLKLERRAEFAEEGQRWYDLLRWGDAVTAMNTHFVSRAINVTVLPYQVLYPIPQREIDISNHIVTQNPGY